MAEQIVTRICQNLTADGRFFFIEDILTGQNAEAVKNRRYERRLRFWKSDRAKLKDLTDCKYSETKCEISKEHITSFIEDKQSHRNP